MVGNKKIAFGSKKCDKIEKNINIWINILINYLNLEKSFFYISHFYQ